MAEPQNKLDLIEMSLETYESLTDDTITDEQLGDLRYIGSDPPPLLSKKKWNKRVGEKDIPYRHKTVIHMAAQGNNYAAIAEQTGYHIGTVQQIVALPGYKERIAHKQSIIFQNDAKGQFKALFMKAYGVVDEILTDPLGEVKPSVRLEAAKYILDHVAGKADQKVTHEVSLLGNLMSELDRAKDVTPQLLATPIEPSYVDVPVDEVEVETKTEMAKAVLGTKIASGPAEDDIELDSLVDDLVPNSFTVGKRS